MKRIKPLLLLIVCFMATLPLSVQAADIWSGEIDTEWYTTNIDATDYTITTAEQLAGLANIVNSTDDFSGTTITLGGDIELGGSADGNTWMPIGDNSSRFNGTFDGGGFLVSGLFINDPDSSRNGLFGEIGIDGTVKNVSVSGTVTSGIRAAGVVGHNSGTVLNCYSMVTVIGVSDVGGVAGFNEGIVANCYNTGMVEASADQAYVGGLVGLNNGGVVANCYNTGNVTGTGNNPLVGGVVGGNDGTMVSNSYWLSSSTTEGVGTTFGSAGDDPTNHVGSFDDMDSEITIDDTIRGNSADSSISTTNLLVALNAGSAIYNETLTDTANRAYRWEQAKDNYPTLTDVEITGDANYDWTVDVDDLRKIAAIDLYNTTVAEGETSPLDINGDGKINFADLAMARNSKNFGK